MSSTSAEAVLTPGTFPLDSLVVRAIRWPSLAIESERSQLGLTLGRVGLLWVNHKVGERRAIFLYAIVAIGCVLHFARL